MTIQLNPCANPGVDKLLLKHDNRPMRALYEALRDTAGVEVPMAIIIDRRCGIERRAEEADVPLHLVGASPLMLAIDARRLDVVKALLAAGADPNAQASDGCNSLMVSARRVYLEFTETLISYGADINAVDEEGNTALHNAAGCGQASQIELLERSGANLEADANGGQTLLHYAVLFGEPGAIKVLLKLGVNQVAVDYEGRTPLHWAAADHDASAYNIEALRYNVAAFEANLTAVDKKGRTPLQVYESAPPTRTSSDDSKIRTLLTPK